MDKGDSNSPTKCLYKQEKKSSELIAKIVPLLEHPITKDDVQRHTEMISNFIDVSQHGFFIQDLSDIIQLIYILTDRIDVTGVYEKLLERILVICCIPPLLNKSSDVLTFARDLQELFTVLGYLLVCLKNNNLRNVAVNALINLLKNSPKHKWYSSLESRKKAADDSRLSEILGQLLAVADDEIYSKLLTLITLMIKDCKNSCKELLLQDALNSLLRRIEPTWRGRFRDIHSITSISGQEVLHYDITSFIIYELLDYLEKHRADLEDVRNIDRFSIWLARCMKESKIKQEGLTILRECLSTTNHLLKNDPGEVIAHSFLYNDGSSILLNAAFPLVGKEQRDQTFSDTRNLNSHPTIADLFLSSRPKIYALLKLLQERHEEVLKIAEEEYKIEIDDLTTKDRVTMLMAENFLALKLGEAWVELEIEFTVMNFKPLPADYKIMSTLVTRYHKWGEYLKETQNEIFREGKEKELIEEQKLYNTFGQSRIKESLEALEELRYIARCTEHMFRISQKYKQQSQIEKSLKKIPFRGNLNKTYFTTLQVTPVFNQEVTLKSEKTTEHEEETINLVSPGNSLVLEDQDLFLEDTLISQEFETLCS
ncbi:uncharacterized protein isoform X3 [Leptinotarsa decemlineata]|uniref:uncharacterized protein isoform X3 n=1 Tax=Leptinotarsa decemlineata TaxID=7539 RepID=UPI003D304FE5